MSAAERFRAAVERGAMETVGELFAPDIVFHSPVTFHPFVGRDTVTRLLAQVAEVFEDFRYTDELLCDGAHGLIFRATVDGREVEGLDLLRMDADGLIADFTVMVRPLSGLVPLAQAMGERVAAVGLEPTRS
jgi:ketosteroid isomerase-like protein